MGARSYIHSSRFSRGGTGGGGNQELYFSLSSNTHSSVLHFSFICGRTTRGVRSVFAFARPPPLVQKLLRQCEFLYRIEKETVAAAAVKATSYTYSHRRYRHSYSGGGDCNPQKHIKREREAGVKFIQSSVGDFFCPV